MSEEAASPTASVWLSDLVSSDVGEILKKSRIALIPVGAIEQHGPHLPVDVDIRLAAGVCEAAALALADELPVVVAPPLPFGISEHHMRFPGTIALSSETFISTVFDIGRSLVRHGFDRLVIVNGHGGNVGALQVIANRLQQETDVQWVVYLSEWQLARDAFAKLRESERGGAGHACEFETSLYLHLRPERARMDRAVKEVVHKTVEGAGFDMFDSSTFSVSVAPVFSYSGVCGDPLVASSSKGRALLEAASENLATIIRNLAKADDPETP